MEKIQNVLKLSNEADEAAIVAEIEKKDIVLTEVVAENEALKERLKVIEEKEVAEKEKAAEELKNKAIELVENAIKEKKILEAEKDSTIEMAVNNFEFVANMISKINNVKDAVKVFDVKNVSKNEERKDWTIRDWEKKDPNGLVKIKNETPEVYNEMYNQFYKK